MRLENQALRRELERYKLAFGELRPDDVTQGLQSSTAGIMDAREPQAEAAESQQESQDASQLCSLRGAQGLGDLGMSGAVGSEVKSARGESETPRGSRQRRRSEPPRKVEPTPPSVADPPAPSTGGYALAARRRREPTRPARRRAGTSLPPIPTSAERPLRSENSLQMSSRSRTVSRDSREPCSRARVVSEAVSRVTQSQLERLEQAHWKEWQFTFGERSHSQSSSSSEGSGRGFSAMTTAVTTPGTGCTEAVLPQELRSKLCSMQTATRALLEP